MTRIWYDTEFIEDGRTIDLISIGLVAEDGREYYAVASDAPWDRIKKNDWLVRNALPSLPVTGGTSLDAYLKNHSNIFPLRGLQLVGPDLADVRVKPRWVIASEVREFILDVPDPELWTWYAAYNHVALCQLWGPMISLPDGIPMWTGDLKQEAGRLGVTELPAMPGVTERDALDDAREARWRHEWLENREAVA